MGHCSSNCKPGGGISWVDESIHDDIFEVCFPWMKAWVVPTKLGRERLLEQHDDTSLFLCTSIDRQKFAKSFAKFFTRVGSHAPRSLSQPCVANPPLSVDALDIVAIGGGEVHRVGWRAQATGNDCNLYISTSHGLDLARS